MLLIIGIIRYYSRNFADIQALDRQAEQSVQVLKCIGWLLSHLPPLWLRTCQPLSPSLSFSLSFFLSFYFFLYLSLYLSLSLSLSLSVSLSLSLALSLSLSLCGPSSLAVCLTKSLIDLCDPCPWQLPPANHSHGQFQGHPAESDTDWSALTNGLVCLQLFCQLLLQR